MSIESLFKSNRLGKYIDKNSLNISPTAKELFKKAEKDEFANMLSSPNQLQLIDILIKVINAKNILEIGVFRGFSTLIMAEALPKKVN